MSASRRWKVTFTVVPSLQSRGVEQKRGEEEEHEECEEMAEQGRPGEGERGGGRVRNEIFEMWHDMEFV